MKRITLPVLAAILIVASCRSSRGVNAMTLPGVCDSIPPRLMSSEARGAQVPAITKIADDYGAIVGSVTDSISERRLQAAGLSLFKLNISGTESQFGREVSSNPSGGFAFDSIPPGRYIVKARRIGYNAIEQRVNTVGGQVDTVNF